MNNSDMFRIEIKYDGRAGWVFYVEQSRLSFPWEILGIDGVGISVPPRKNGMNIARSIKQNGLRDEGRRYWSE